MPKSPPTATTLRNDPTADAAVRFAATVARTRGHLAESDFTAVKAAGTTGAQVIEIVQHVALNVWTNVFNEVFQTEIDFPIVEACKAA
jgi:alkylhydroperoxidase family enzyme